MTEREALKLALEALEYFSDTATLNMDKAMSEDAITAIKEALAQPEQDSCYGYKGKCNRVMSDGNPCGLNAPCPDCGLSLIDCPKPQPWEKFCDSNCVWTDHHPDCKLAEQEPVATDWERIARVQDAKLRAMCNEAGGFEKLCEVMDKYERTTPPQRKPLTDEEVNEFFQGMEPNNGFWLSFARAIEAAHGIYAPTERKGEA